jgi:hypothetical protein
MLMPMKPPPNESNANSADSLLTTGFEASDKTLILGEEVFSFSILVESLE